MIIRTPLALALLAGMTACATTAAAPPETRPSDSGNQCDNIRTGNWTAWIDKMPGPDRDGPILHVAGEAYVNHPGWTFTLEKGAVSAAFVPRQLVYLVAKPSVGAVRIPQKTEKIHGRFPRAGSKYESIQVICKGQLVAEVVPEVVY